MSSKNLAFLMIVVILNFISFNKAYASDDCPQERKTRKAPAEYAKLKNPLKMSADNIKEGRELYLKNAKPAPCYRCHGKEGNSDSRMAKLIRPRPRIFTCKKTMSEISDGQAFWVIRKGSKGSGMSGYPEGLLSDDELWKIMTFVRSLAE